MKTDEQLSGSKVEEFTSKNYEKEIEDLTVPFFPTPPYENTDDWIVPMDLQQSAVSSVSDERRSEADDLNEITSEFETNDLFDFSKYGAASTIDQLVNDLDNIPEFQECDVDNSLVQQTRQAEQSDINEVTENKTEFSVNLHDSESDSNVSGDESIISITEETNSKYIPMSCKNLKRHSNSSIESNESFEPAIKMLKVSYADQFHHDVEEVPLRKKYTKQRESLHKGKTLPKSNRIYAKDKEEQDILANVHPSRRAAVQAKLNREKKKAYINELETQTSTLKSENIALTESKLKLERNCEKLQNEVAYLRNVLANQSTLSGLLKNIGNTEGIVLKSSFVSSQKTCSVGHESDHDYIKQSQESYSKSEVSTQNRWNSGGICLHVDKNNVSLEFCSKCAKKAKLT